MYKANAKRSPNTPQSPNGVQFFSQFPRSWIRPYGLADIKPPTAAKVLQLKPLTCEWLLRPKVTLSELAESVDKNLNHLIDDNTGLLENEAKQNLHHSLALLLQNLVPLGRSLTGEATRENVVETLKFLFAENEGLDEQMDTLFSLGGAMFTMASQYIAARSFIRNPNIYANVVQATDGSDAAFQKAGDIKSMRDFILNSVFPPRRYVSRSSGERRNLLSAFDDVEPSTSTSTYNNTPVMDNTRETDLFDLPMASQPNTLPKLFSLNPKIVNNEPPIAIESEEDDEGEENINDHIPHDIPQDIPREINKKRTREPEPVATQDVSLQPGKKQKKKKKDKKKQK